MPKSFEQIHCQRCRAANPLGEELCAQCGTRLMLVVEPSSLRFDEELTFRRGHDEHLVERISLLENRLLRIVGKVEQTLDLLMRQTRISYLDHLLLESLIGVLDEAGTINEEKLKDLWRERCELEGETTAQEDQKEKLPESIIAQYRGPEKESFTYFIEEGFDLLHRGESVRAMRSLERAAALAPDHALLNAFIGELFFRTGEIALARDYLARAFEAEPSDYRTCLLLGLACGDTGDASRARVFLSEVVRQSGASFAAHYALGRLLVAEAKWTNALGEFKRALAARDCPEAHYVLGLVNYQLKRYRGALRHLRKAVAMDPQYAEALYALGFIYVALGERARASHAFDAARAAGGDESRCRAARRYLSRPKSAPLPLLFESARGRKKQLVTGGDSRLLALLCEDALSMTAAR